VKRGGVLARAVRALGAGLLLLAVAGAVAQNIGLARASAVKAAFLYRFGSFVEWPAGTFRAPNDPLVIGVFGDESVAIELEQLTLGRRIETHPVAVRRVRDADDVGALHILFVGGPRDVRARDVLAAVRGPVLTVGESRGGGRAAPVLHFTEVEGRVRFSASLTAAAGRGLKLSAKLLAVAHEVEGR